MFREKCVILTDCYLHFFYVNPYLKFFVFVKNLPDDNIGIPDM